MNMTLLVGMLALPPLVSIAAKRRIEEVCAPLVCALMLVLYALAALDALNVFPWVLLAAITLLTVAVSVKFCNKKQIFAGGGSQREKSLKKTLGNLLTPGALVMIGLMVFWVLKSEWHIVHATDDIYYWGIEAHSIYAHTGFVDASRHLSPRFMNYTPGMQLWDWVGLRMAEEWNEGVLYAMLWAFYAAFLAPLTRRITWRRAYLAPIAALVLLCLPTVLNRDAYDMLRVDTALGLCTGYAFIQVWQIAQNPDKKRWETVCLSLAMGAMVLIKQIGAAWCVLAVLPLLHRKGRSARRLLTVSALPVALLVSWKVLCAALHLSGIHTQSLSLQTQALFNGTLACPDNLMGMVMRTLVYTDFWGTGTGGWHTLPYLVWCVVLMAALVWLFPSKEKRGVAIWAGCAAVLFVLGYALLLGFSLYRNAGADSSLYNLSFLQSLTERYGCPLPMGLLVLALFCAMEQLNVKRARIAAAAMAVLVLLCAHWPAMRDSFCEEVYNENHLETCYDTEQMENFWVDSLDEMSPAVVLYGTSNRPYVTERLQYAVAPHKVVVCAEPSMTETDFINWLRENNVTHAVFMDDGNGAYQAAYAYAEDEELYELEPYAVHWDENEPVLVLE